MDHNRQSQNNGKRSDLVTCLYKMKNVDHYKIHLIGLITSITFFYKKVPH